MPHNRAQLVSQSSRAIKQLLNFKPSHTVPKEVNTATARFAKICAEGDIAAELEAVWNRCREDFGYKRKDKLGPTMEAGLGTLILPDFRYSVSAELDASNPKLILWRQSVDEIKDLNTVLSPAFNSVFLKSFDSFESDFSEPQIIEDLIDRAEAMESSLVHVNYPADCSSCEITLKQLAVSVFMTPSYYRISQPGCMEPRQLLEKILAFQNAIQCAEPSMQMNLFLASDFFTKS